MEFKIQYQGKIKKSKAADISSFATLLAEIKKKFPSSSQNLLISYHDGEENISIQNQEEYEQMALAHKKVKIVVKQNQKYKNAQMQSQQQQVSKKSQSFYSISYSQSREKNRQQKQLQISIKKVKGQSHNPFFKANQQNSFKKGKGQSPNLSIKAIQPKIQSMEDQNHPLAIKNKPIQMQSINNKQTSQKDNLALISQNKQVQNTSKKVVIFFGHTQSGKSSTIRDLTGDTLVVCGSGSGSSTTSVIRIHQPIKPKLSDSYIFMDTIGMGDNSLQFTPQQIRQQIESNVISLSDAQKCDEIQALIITQPLRDGAYQLPNTLETINQIFGNLPNKSIIVLGTKSHNEDQNDVKIRQNGIKEEVMRDFKIPLENYIRFATTYKKRNDSDIDQAQYTRLEELLAKCEKIDAKSITEKHQRIRQMAKEFQVKMTEEKKHPYTHTWTDQKWMGWIGKIFGLKDIKVKSEIRFHLTKHQPPLEYCFKLALQKFEQQVRSSLLGMK